MICKACWREAKRMALRANAPQNRLRGVTKRIYMSYHKSTDEEGVCGHIRPGGYRRHKNGRVVIDPSAGPAKATAQPYRMNRSNTP